MGADQATVTVTGFSTTADFKFDSPDQQGERRLWVRFRVPGQADVGFRILTGDNDEATGTEDIVCDGYMSIELPFGDLTPGDAEKIADGCHCSVQVNQLDINYA